MGKGVVLPAAGWARFFHREGMKLARSFVSETANSYCGGCLEAASVHAREKRVRLVALIMRTARLSPRNISAQTQRCIQNPTMPAFSLNKIEQVRRNEAQVDNARRCVFCRKETDAWLPYRIHATE